MHLYNNIPLFCFLFSLNNLRSVLSLQDVQIRPIPLDGLIQRGRCEDAVIY